MFLGRAENVVLAWATRSGQGAPADQARSHRRGGRPTRLLATLTGLIEPLIEARAAGEFSRRLRVLTHSALLVVDGVGYLPISQDGAVLCLELINARRECASTVLTSNKGSRNIDYRVRQVRRRPPRLGVRWVGQFADEEDRAREALPDEEKERTVGPHDDGRRRNRGRGY